MQPSARRALRRLVLGVVALTALLAAVAFVRHLLRSDEERLSEAVDEARDALVEREREAFLGWFAPEVRYRETRDRAALESDYETWARARVGRVTIVERKIEVDGTRATIRLRCDVGHVFQTFRTVDVTLEAAKTEDGWRVTSFDWR